jgi:hypothetical protein
MDRIERIDGISGSGTAAPVTAVQRNAQTDPDGSRRDHPEGEEALRPKPRPTDAPPDDGLPHVDVRA